LDDPLIAVRAAHFAATALTAGVLAFLVLVAKPAVRTAATAEGWQPFERQCLWIVWIGLAATLLSGAVWVVLQVEAMSGLPLGEAFAEGMPWTVLTQTQFGIVSDVRLGLAALLAASLALDGSNERARWMSLSCAAALLGTLAGTGHAAGTVGLLELPHLAGDVLHVLAAGAWIGGLVPLALLLATASRHNDGQWASVAHKTTRRFSVLGMVSVGTLMVTGILNAWILVGSLPALVGTEYGRLLVVKLGLFGVMLCLAAVNRLHLMPRLALQGPSPAPSAALRQLTRTSTIELGLGLGIFVIVGVLGTIHPAIHLIPP
jgi:putative copper resistance protein D